MRRSSARVLCFLLFLSILPSMSTQRLHRNPEWPTDDEFRSVNQAVDVACGLYPKVEQSLAWALIWKKVSTIHSLWAEGAKSVWVN